MPSVCVFPRHVVMPGEALRSACKQGSSGQRSGLHSLIKLSWQEACLCLILVKHIRLRHSHSPDIWC